MENNNDGPVISCIVDTAKYGTYFTSINSKILQYYLIQGHIFVIVQLIIFTIILYINKIGSSTSLINFCIKAVNGAYNIEWKVLSYPAIFVVVSILLYWFIVHPIITILGYAGFITQTANNEVFLGHANMGESSMTNSIRIYNAGPSKDFICNVKPGIDYSVSNNTDGHFEINSTITKAGVQFLTSYCIIMIIIYILILLLNIYICPHVLYMGFSK